MNASDLQWFVTGLSVPLVIKILIAWAEASAAAREVRERLDEHIPQPDPEYAGDYSTREARRVDRPLYERSVPGVIVREVDIDLAHRVVNAEPGSITYLRGARAE